MYRIPAMLFQNKNFRILDVGCGVGHGANLLNVGNCFSEFVGIDTDKACIDCARERFKDRPRDDMSFITTEIFDLHDFQGFEDEDDKYDLVLCFETLEHIRWELRRETIEAMRKYTGHYLFISTPESSTNPRGVYSLLELEEILERLDLAVIAVPAEFTNYFLCEVT